MELGFNRRNIGRLVLLAWAVALAWLARRQFYQGDSIDTARRTTRLAPGAQYYAVYAGARQIGQLNLAVDTTLDGVRLTELFTIDVPEGDSTQQLARGSEYYLSRSLRLRTFSRTMFGRGRREQLAGLAGADSILSLTNTEGPTGEPAKMRVRIPPDAILATMLSYRVAFSGQLHVGGRFLTPLLDLATGVTRPMIVKVTAESTFVVADSATWDPQAGQWAPATSDTIQAWRLEHDATGAPTISWVDATGALVYQETRGGLRLVRNAFEIVRNNYRRIRVTSSSAWRRSVPGMTALISTRRIPDTTAVQREFLLVPDSATTVRGVAHALPGGRQRGVGDTVIVSRVTPPDTSTKSAMDARIGLESSWETPLTGGGVDAAAQRALAGARTLYDSAAQLTRWVAREVAIDTSDKASATAGSTLQTRRGNADGKARLLATLAKASGIPARVVTGLAVLPEGSFGHSWTELWLNGWWAADPTYGHFPASPALVRLSVGQRSHVLDLLEVAASARFLPLRKPL